MTHSASLKSPFILYLIIYCFLFDSIAKQIICGFQNLMWSCNEIKIYAFSFGKKKRNSYAYFFFLLLNIITEMWTTINMTEKFIDSYGFCFQQVKLQVLHLYDLLCVLQHVQQLQPRLSLSLLHWVSLMNARVNIVQQLMKLVCP